MPQTEFEVIGLEKYPNHQIVKLREIPTAISENIIFWVDDKPENNYKIAEKYEQKGFSFIFCTTTKQAIVAITRHRWMITLQKTNVKIITDMARLEQDGKMNYEAGICLIEEIMKNFKYDFDILIHCYDTLKAEENLKSKKLKFTGSLTITSSLAYLQDFILQTPSFMVFGVAGKGKSTLLNFIIDGKDSQRFKGSNSAISVTTEIQEFSGKPYNIEKEVTIYDVPGLLTSNIPFSKWREMVFDKISFVNAVIWVVSANDRVTCSDMILLKAMKFIFDNLVIEKQLILVITHSDSLKENQIQKFADEFIGQLNESYNEHEKIQIIHRINFGLNEISKEFQCLLNSLNQDKISIKRHIDSKEMSEGLTNALNKDVYNAFIEEITETILPMQKELEGKKEQKINNGECNKCSCKNYSYNSTKTFNNNRLKQKEVSLEPSEIVINILTLGFVWVYKMFFSNKTCECSHAKKDHYITNEKLPLMESHAYRYN